MFFAAGRMTDAYGQASFAAQVDYGELPQGEEQVPNLARVNSIRPRGRRGLPAPPGPDPAVFRKTV